MNFNVFLPDQPLSHVTGVETHCQIKIKEYLNYNHLGLKKYY